MNLRAHFSPLSSHILKPAHILYVDLVVHFLTLLKSSSIIFSLKIVFFKTCSQIGNLLLKLGVLILVKFGVLFGRIEKLILERVIQLAQRGQNNVAKRMIKFVIKIFNLNGSRL
jgi:hypothetical protein